MSNARLATVLAAGVGMIFLGPLAVTEALGNEGAKDFITVRLDSTRYNAGRTGNAVVYPVGDKTGITITASGVPSYASRPIHLYSYLFEGSCANRAPGPTYTLTDHTLAESIVRPTAVGAFRGPVRISHSVALPFERLRATSFAISVRVAPADGNYEIFCGSSPS
ncbi:hypothetical protein [Azoarcus sp. KH32C]|uniref:hypothetical protein n=1 Tax=Azoarcus sp. KH32C TaxID=748247 RepID=UPI000238668C|nr:hypothetical protein [Azoarcus sp. KH32C]BAL26368.1 hypothetical protein AZKH_4088 [Azoarcus sp. KH32C]